MRISTYEKVCRNVAIAIMLLGLAMWIYYFRELVDLFMEYGISYSLAEIFRGWYAEIIPIFVDIIGITLLIVFRKKGLPVILGVCAIVIAVECAVDAYLLLVEFKEIFNADLGFFLEGAISLVIAGMLLFNAILYSIGATKSATLIKYATIALILLQILSVITEVRSGSDFVTIVTDREYEFSSYMMLILVLVMSVSKYTKQASLMGIVKTSVRDLRNSVMVEGIGIDRSIAARFSDFNKNGLWCSSYSFILTTFNLGVYSMSLTDVGGNMVGRITSVENGSGMNVFRFNVTGVWFDTGDVSTCDVMRFYGTEGLFIQLIVRDPEQQRPKKVPRLGAVILTSREEGTTTHKIRVKVAAAVGFAVKHVVRFRNYVRTEIFGRMRKKKE